MNGVISNSTPPSSGVSDHLTPIGMGVIGGMAACSPLSPSLNDLTVLSQADLSGLGDYLEENITTSEFDIDNIFADVSFKQSIY